MDEMISETVTISHIEINQDIFFKCEIPTAINFVFPMRTVNFAITYQRNRNAEAAFTFGVALSTSMQFYNIAST